MGAIADPAHGGFVASPKVGRLEACLVEQKR
jgi:hypothetical protein